MVQRRDLLGDREPQPEPAPRAERVAVDLAERIEDARQEVRGDPAAAVLDVDHDRSLLPRDGDGDPAAGIGELHGVREQVVEHLAQARLVGLDLGEDRRPAALEPGLPGERGGRDRLERAAQHALEVERAQIEVELAADRAGHVEQIADQARLRPRALLDRVERLRV